MLNAVHEFDTRIDLIRRHFNIFYNDGCLMGPGTSPGGEKFLRHSLVTDYANKRLNTLDPESWQKDLLEFEGLDLSRSFEADDQRLALPSEEKIDEVLKMINRQEQKDNDVGCESCGYPNCREFAIAIAQGLATTDMCHIFSGRNRQEYIRTLRMTNEKLAKTQEALRISEEKAKHEKDSQKETYALVSSMLQQLVSGVVIVDENLRILHANKAFIRILGEEAAMVDEVIPGLEGADLKSLLPIHFYKLFSFVLSSDEAVERKDVQYGEGMLNVSVFPLRTKKFVGGIIRDMYMPEVYKEQIVTRMNEVVDQNFDMVQKIAFLLGEGAAKTEQMLNSIIELHKSQNRK